MNAMANTTPIVTTVMKTTTKEKTPNRAEAASRVNVLDFCEEHYEDILTVMDKICRNKRKEVHTRLEFGGNSRKSRRMREYSQNTSAKTLSARYRNPSERPQIRDRLRNNYGNVFGRLGHRRQSAFKRLSDTYSPSTTKSGPDREYSKDGSYSRGRPHKRDFSPSKDRPRSRDSSYGIEESYDEEDLAVPWSCEEVDPFTPRIRNFKSLRKTRMPNNVKTYDGTGDLKDHVKKFQAAAQVERWAMPTWCHMFNSTLIGTVRVWFEELPPESIDGYKDLKAVFLTYFMQQKKYVKDPVEIHNIKQNDRETIEDFIKRFKSVEEMMIATAACIRGETVVASKKKVHTPWKSQDQSKRKTQNFAYVKEITFSPLTANKGTGGPLVIEAEISGHAVHRIYVDGGSSMEVLYEHCFNWLRPEIKSQMVLACDNQYDSFASRNFSWDDDLPLPDNEDKVFNPRILIHEKSVTIITRVTQEKKLAISFASLVFEEFDPPFYELLVFKVVPNSMRLLSFSSENKEKVFKPGIYTSEKLSSLQTIKEVQSLNGKLASLNRFISKSTEKSLPLFKTSKKCIKKSDFHWTQDAEHAFKQLKQHLARLPCWCWADTNKSRRNGFTYALMFQFTASNNEAEYEALIVVLRIAAQMGVRNVYLSVDSMLVANQVLGTYIAKEEVKYLEKAKSLTSGFANFSISQVPRSKNKKADSLSKIASSNIDFMKPFGCPVTILNTLDHLGKFGGKADEGFLVGYFVNRRGAEWLFDIDSLTKSMNYEPVTAGNQTNDDADDKDTNEVPGKGDKGVSEGSEIDDQERTDSSLDSVDLPNGKRAIGTKRVFRNKKDERGIVVRNKARLVAQGYTQEKGIDYDEVFTHVARIEGISLRAKEQGNKAKLLLLRFCL
nr:reverse transcriptase domain-containing protein [Tanacetum cinerariifolium]